MDPLPRTFKIIVIGDSNVGKTCLTYRFCEGKFLASTEATIGVDFREKTVQLDGETIKLQLWDTAGQERYRRSMIPHYYRNVHAVVFVYDVTNPESFHNLPMWIEECDEHHLNKNLPRIIVGNKCDAVLGLNGQPPQMNSQQQNLGFFSPSGNDMAAMYRKQCPGGLASSPFHVPIATAQRLADTYGMPLFETSAKDNTQADYVESIFMTLAHRLKSQRPLMSASYLASLQSDQWGGSDGVRNVPEDESHSETANGGFFRQHPSNWLSSSSSGHSSCSC